jgi:perosamine synthetase
MIPVFEPEITEEDVQAVADAVRRGEISGSFGETIPAFEREFAQYCGRRHGVSTTSGTTALHLAVAALDIRPGDEVLMSASTNIATALAVYHLGGVSVPVDSEDESWNLDLDLVEKLITPRTRAIIPVHLYGHPVPMDRVCEIAQRHKLAVIEDCAESHGATWNGKLTGAFGEMACFSFYANKIITTGEGGMIVTDDDRLAEQMRLLRNLAFGKPRFLHEHAGYNFRMTGMQAALGRSQFRRIGQFIDGKRRMAATYNRLLKGIPGVRTPPELPGAKNVYWMYAITVGPEFGMTRDELADYLRANGVDTRTFFCPMSMQPFLRKQRGWRDVPTPVAERLWRTGLYLPSACSLGEDAIASICGRIRQAALARA